MREGVISEEEEEEEEEFAPERERKELSVAFLAGGGIRRHSQ